MLRLEGPQVGAHTREYEGWCEGLVGWLRSCDCPVQLLTVVGHIDRCSAERAFDETLDFEPRDGPLVAGQRSYCGEFASLSLRIDHYAVLAPRLADLDGRPHAANGIWSLLSPLPEASRGEAERALRQRGGRRTRIRGERRAGLGSGDRGPRPIRASWEPGRPRCRWGARGSTAGS